MRKTILVVLLLTTFAAAGGKKTYPLTGTVVSFHAQAETGGFSNKTGVYVGTYETRVYVVKTDSGTLEITRADCNCKATPVFAIGQVLRYRSEKSYVHIVLENGKEQRYYVLSAE